MGLGSSAAASDSPAASPFGKGLSFGSSPVSTAQPSSGFGAPASNSAFGASGFGALAQSQAAAPFGAASSAASSGFGEPYQGFAIGFSLICESYVLQRC